MFKHNALRKIDKLITNYLRIKRSYKHNRRFLVKSRRARPQDVAHKLFLFKKQVDRIIIDHSFFKLHNFFSDNQFLTIPSDNNVLVCPQEFSLKSNFNETIDYIKKTISTIWVYAGSQVELDFTKCQKCDSGSLFLLGLLAREYQEFFRKLDKRLSILTVQLKFKITPSKNPNVNILLMMNQFIPEVKADSKPDLEPVLSLEFTKGTKIETHYLRNQKGPVTTKMVGFVNNCLRLHQYMLNATGVNHITSIIAEILGNAEDHGQLGDWYVAAAFLRNQDTNIQDVIGELNLSIANFGYSFYEGFEKTKTENFDVYDRMEILYEKVKSDFPNLEFTRENLFTLYALQDQFSRLKFERESRGTGTMKFINSFLELGDYEDTKKGFNPHLMILSGNTKIICDTKYKPFLKNENYYISLNDEKDLTKLPNSANLISTNRHFPGTLLNVKIYLNKSNLDKKTNFATDNGN